MKSKARVRLMAPLILLLTWTGVSVEASPEPLHRSILIFSRTQGFRHDSIEKGTAALREIAAEFDSDIIVDATEDPARFTTEGLAAYDAVVFLNTTGDVLDAQQQAAFESYIRSGGGYMGIHSASDTEYDWPWYGELMGAWFSGHPQIQEATIIVNDPGHASTESLPLRWTRTDEWYNFQRNPRGDVHVLATIDEKSYSGGSNGFDHPIAWCHDFDGGRSFYTAGGHTQESFDEPGFRSHLLGGLRYVTGDAPGGCDGTLDAKFDLAVLDDNTSNPVEVAVAPDGRVFYIEREGRVRLYDPGTGVTTTAGSVSVNTSNEDGLIGLALDPDFATSPWLYLFYSPAGDEPIQHISRFPFDGNQLDLAAEQIIIKVPTQRETCCHSGGSIEFGPDGLFYIGTGDNTNPFSSDGFTPIDERPERTSWDAQRSSGNTNDLRGKILRIKVESDGSYSVPSGNLFATEAEGRPEVYVMGARNPYRFSFDADTGWLYWGEVGPDAQGDNGTRGPAGHDEWNQVREAGNYGWPYCIANNKAYVDFDFQSESSGSAFSCSSPINESPNNTGATDLPPAQPAWIWYQYGDSSVFPELGGGGRTALAGPVYQYDEALDSDTKLPAYYDNTLFIYEWARNWIKEVKLDENGDILKINPFTPNFELKRPIDMEMGPDGAIYMLEWGTGFGGNNDDSRLIKISYIRGNRAPVAKIGSDVVAGPLPLTVNFNSEGTFDPDPGDGFTYEWSFTGADGDVSTEANPTFTYTVAGGYTATLTVTDTEGNKSTVSLPIVAGNSMPEFELLGPEEGGIFSWANAVGYRVKVSDAEDGSTDSGGIDCADIITQPLLGHDDHTHPLAEFSGCEGSFVTEDGHGDVGDDIFHVVEIRYTDRGNGDAPSLTGRKLAVLQPQQKQTQHFSKNNGVQFETTADWKGGIQNAGFIDHGDYLVFDTFNFRNIDYVTFRVASAGVGGRIEVRQNTPSGRLLGTAYVAPTGGWQEWEDITIPVTDPGGTFNLVLWFGRQPGDGGLFNVNFFEFHGRGISRVVGPAPGLKGTYFKTQELEGESIEVTEPVVNFRWEGAPWAGFPPDNFSARWEGFLRPEKSGRYRLITKSDDGSRLYLDGDLMVSQWSDHAAEEQASELIFLNGGQVYSVRLEFYESAGGAEVSLMWTNEADQKEVIPARMLFSEEPPVVSTEDSRPRVLTFALHPPYPNPTSGGLTIDFEIPDPSDVTLALFDVQGRRVRSLRDAGKVPAGLHSVRLDGGDLASGVYVVRLVTEDGILSRKVTVVR